MVGVGRLVRGTPLHGDCCLTQVKLEKCLSLWPVVLARTGELERAGVITPWCNMQVFVCPGVFARSGNMQVFVCAGMFARSGNMQVFVCAGVFCVRGQRGVPSGTDVWSSHCGTC